MCEIVLTNKEEVSKILRKFYDTHIQVLLSSQYNDEKSLELKL